jgi:hydrogenase nickel incorporation protein HypA/HybF
MHEWSIVEALLARVDDEVRARGATRVHRLRVRLGALSGVEPALLASAYEAFRAGTACADAPLELVPGSARWRCTRCGVDVPAAGALACPRCGARTTLAAGDEILLERIEMEVP